MPPRRSKAKPRAKKPRRVADSLTVSVLQATLESTADGILVVDLNGKIVSHNRHFEEMWRLPPELIAANNAAAGRRRLIAHVQDQLVNAHELPDDLQERHADPEPVGLDVLMFKDGRGLDRRPLPRRWHGR